jgi:hypothetical protein
MPFTGLKNTGIKPGVGTPATSTGPFKGLVSVPTSSTAFKGLTGTPYVPPPSLLQRVAEPFKGLMSLYGGGKEGIANKLKEDIVAGAEDIEKGDVIKGITKSGFRTAGDIAGLIYAPVGTAINSVLAAFGVSKGFDKVGELSATKSKWNPLDRITDIPAVQKWAMAHPNADKDFERALNLILSKAERNNEVNPKKIVNEVVNKIFPDTPPEVKKLIVDSTGETTKVPVKTPKTKQAAYSKEMGYEPIKPVGELPVIDYGKTAKPTELPTIQVGETPLTKMPGYKYEPIKAPEALISTTQSRADLLKELKQSPRVEETTTVYHGTSAENANKINTEGFKTGGGKGVSGQTSNDFVYATENKVSASKYVSDRLSIKNPTVLSGEMTGKILDIPGKIADFEAFGEASKKLGVPLGIDSQGKLSMLDMPAIKKAMKEQGYGAIRFSDKYADGSKAFAILPEQIKTKTPKAEVTPEQRDVISELAKEREKTNPGTPEFEKKVQSVWDETIASKPESYIKDRAFGRITERGDNIPDTAYYSYLSEVAKQRRLKGDVTLATELSNSTVRNVAGQALSALKVQDPYIKLLNDIKVQKLETLPKFQKNLRENIIKKLDTEFQKLVETVKDSKLETKGIKDFIINNLCK